MRGRDPGVDPSGIEGFQNIRYASLALKRPLIRWWSAVAVTLAVIGAAGCSTQSASVSTSSPPAPPSTFFDFTAQGASHYVASGQYAQASLETSQTKGAAAGLELRITNSGMPSDISNGMRDALLTLPKGPVDLTGASQINFWVNDIQGANTVYVILGDAAGNRAGTWSKGKSVKGQWVEVSAPLQAFSGIDLHQVVVVGVGEWNSGLYYFDGLAAVR